ncbi:MAG: type II toxin-antitoxin system HicB family antitoxin [Acidimicrobiales bacterium]
MPATRPTYTATFERAENGTWMVALVEEPNVHGYGDTLVEARRNIRDAIATLFGPFEPEADGFELVEEVRLPEAVLAVVRRARLQRTQAHQQRAEARAAEEAVAATTRQATAVTRQAALLLVEHGDLVKAEADNAELAQDIRLPDALLLTVERAHLERTAARRHRESARAAQEAAAVSASEAVATNREAARLLIEHCGLTTAEAADLLGLSTQRTQRPLDG